MRKEWVLLVEFLQFLQFLELPPGAGGARPSRAGGVPHQVRHSGQIQQIQGKDLQEGQEWKGFPLPRVQKWGLSCLKYIHMRGILSSPPTKKD